MVGDIDNKITLKKYNVINSFFGVIKMIKVYVYNYDTNTVEKYDKNLTDAMPYINGRTLTVAEFKSNSSSSIVWTDKRMLIDWNAFRSGWGQSIDVGFAFKRIWEGGHGNQSQHYAGTALDVAQYYSNANREVLRDYAISSDLWSYVGNATDEPTWVHVDDRFGIPACAKGGYPILSYGSRGNYVFIIQDALMALGYLYGALDGIFGNATRNALLNFQVKNKLSVSGTTDCNTWSLITSITNGMGRTATVII